MGAAASRQQRPERRDAPAPARGTKARRRPAGAEGHLPLGVIDLLVVGGLRHRQFDRRPLPAKRVVKQSGQTRPVPPTKQGSNARCRPSVAGRKIRGDRPRDDWEIPGEQGGPLVCP